MKIDNKVIVKFLICIIATLAIITLKNNKFYWELDGSGISYPYHQETNGFMGVRCACGL